MEQSFRAGLGEKSEGLMVEYDTDTLKGGD
jgi:hypothetical protein